VSIYFVMFHVLNAIKRLFSIYYRIPYNSINMQGMLAHGAGTQGHFFPKSTAYDY
jgi:hypothetical protein